MKKIHSLYLAFYVLAFVLLSCNQYTGFDKNAIQKVSLNDFEEKINVNGNELNFDFETEFKSIHTLDSLLILETSAKHKEVFKVFNLKNFKHLGNLGLRGEGPNEFQHIIPTRLHKKNNQYLLDVSDRFNGYVKSIDVLKSLNNQPNYPIIENEYRFNASAFPVNSALVNDDFLFGDFGYEDDTNSIFKRLNLQTEQTKFVGVFPKIKNSHNLPGPVLYKFYVGGFNYNQKYQKIVHTNSIINRINIIDRELNLLKSIVDGENWQDNYFNANETDFLTANFDQFTEGHVSTTTSDEYIFTRYVQRYEDRNIKSTVDTEEKESIFKVFDWNGSPLKLLTLNNCIARSAAFNETNNKLYVLDVVNEKILSFDLNKYF